MSKLDIPEIKRQNFIQWYLSQLLGSNFYIYHLFLCFSPLILKENWNSTLKMANSILTYSYVILKSWPALK